MNSQLKQVDQWKNETRQHSGNVTRAHIFFSSAFSLLLSLFYICEEMLFSTITFVQMILVLILCIIFYTCALFLPLKRVNRDRYIWKETMIFSSCCFIYVKAVLLMKKKNRLLWSLFGNGMECFNFIFFAFFHEEIAARSGIA